MATKRMYVAVAADFKSALNRDDICSDTVAFMARKVAEVFKNDNPRFRYDTFFQACNLDGFGYVRGTK